MVTEGKIHSILINEESGAGKIEKQKMLMSYLAFMRGRSGKKEITVEKQVLEVRNNFILCDT